MAGMLTRLIDGIDREGMVGIYIQWQEEESDGIDSPG